MEEWKDIEGWEGKYQVSNYGDIKRLERDIKNRRYCDCKYWCCCFVVY